MVQYILVVYESNSIQSLRISIRISKRTTRTSESPFVPLVLFSGDIQYTT